LRRAYGTPAYLNPPMPRIPHGCAPIWILVSSIMFPTRSTRVFHAFSTNDRKSSTPRRTNNRRHTRSHAITTFCACGIPTPMPRCSYTTRLRRRLSMPCRLVLMQHRVHQAPPSMPALEGRPLINRLLARFHPPTMRTLPGAFPGSQPTPGWPMISGFGTTLRNP
jgi:hypothetical protein